MDDGRGKAWLEEEVSNLRATIRHLQMLILAAGCVIGVLAGALLR